jgi:uncharacterized membrane protein
MTGLVTILACDVLFAIIALPLMLRKVPPNPVYGFRTPTTLKNESIWYETNAYFGRGMLLSSVISALLIVVLHGVWTVPDERFLLASVGALVVPFFVATVAAFRFSRSMRDRMGDRRNR